MLSAFAQIVDCCLRGESIHCPFYKNVVHILTFWYNESKKQTMGQFWFSKSKIYLIYRLPEYHQCYQFMERL